MLAGCGGNSSTGSNADISAFVDTDKTLDITWLGYPQNIDVEEGLPCELLIEEKFNVNIKPLYLESAKYNDKKKCLLQAGDIPDLIYEMDPMYLFADA